MRCHQELSPVGGNPQFRKKLFQMQLCKMVNQWSNAMEIKSSQEAGEKNYIQVAMGVCRVVVNVLVYCNVVM